MFAVDWRRSHHKVFSHTASLWWGSPYIKFLKIQLGLYTAKHFWLTGFPILSRSCPDPFPMVLRGCGVGVARVR